MHRSLWSKSAAVTRSRPIKAISSRAASLRQSSLPNYRVIPIPVTMAAAAAAATTAPSQPILSTSAQNSRPLLPAEAAVTTANAEARASSANSVADLAAEFGKLAVPQLPIATQIHPPSGRSWWGHGFAIIAVVFVGGLLHSRFTGGFVPSSAGQTNLGKRAAAAEAASAAAAVVVTPESGAPPKAR